MIQTCATNGVKNSKWNLLQYNKRRWMISRKSSFAKSFTFENFHGCRKVISEIVRCSLPDQRILDHHKIFVVCNQIWECFQNRLCNTKVKNLYFSKLRKISPGDYIYTFLSLKIFQRSNFPQANFLTSNFKSPPYWETHRWSIFNGHKHKNRESQVYHLPQCSE